MTVVTDLQFLPADPPSYSDAEISDRFGMKKNRPVSGWRRKLVKLMFTVREKYLKLIRAEMERLDEAFKNFS